MRVFWYISRDKLTALPAEPGFLSRLAAKVKFGLGPASVEAGIGERAAPGLVNSLSKVERRLRKEASVVSVGEIAESRLNGPLFVTAGHSTEVVLARLVRAERLACAVLG